MMGNIGTQPRSVSAALAANAPCWAAPSYQSRDRSSARAPAALDRYLTQFMHSSTAHLQYEHILIDQLFVVCESGSR